MKSICLIIAGSLLAFSNVACADSNLANGGAIFVQKCAPCHSLERGVNRVGPSLLGVVEEKPASLRSFAHYSESMRAFGATGRIWDDETLAAFLKHPRDLVPETNMAFGGIKKPDDMADLIAYLRAFSRQ